MLFPNFSVLIEHLTERMRAQSYSVHTEKWQSIDISKRPEAEMRELMSVYFQVALMHENLEHYQKEMGPNLPWADRHFEIERVSGKPINPGTTWREWPYAHSADKFRRIDERFSHTYAERYWPKQAGELYPPGYPLQGVRYSYGDLRDVVTLLAREPLTRQAYLPVWFPEDTGVVHGERVPCTLGYHFLMRNNYLHLFYPIRSCDFVRHFRDDLYLTLRLLFWVLDELRKIDSSWKTVRPGMFSMWIGSLHCFVNDWRVL